MFPEGQALCALSKASLGLEEESEVRGQPYLES